MGTAQIDKTAIREYVSQELPAILEENLEIQKMIEKISQKKFVGREVTDDRFERLFEELKLEREENNRRWEENNKKLDVLIRRSDERFAAMLQEIKAIRRKLNMMMKGSCSDILTRLGWISLLRMEN